MEILIILLLIALNGFFAMSEIAIVSSRKARLEEEAKKGNTKAKIVLQLSLEPEELLSAVQVGITLIGIISGVYGGVALTEDLVPYIAKISFLNKYATEVSYFLVVGLITYFSLVIGELAPKTIAINNPEKIAIAIAPFIKYLTKASYPVVYVLSISTKILVKLFRVKENTNPPVTEEELKLLIDQGASFGSIEQKEGELLKRIFKFGDRKANSIMTQRHDIIWLDINKSPEELKKTILSTDISVYPVCEGGLDNIIGIMDVRDYFKYLYDTNTNTSIREIIKEPVYIPYNFSSIKIIEKFKESRFYTAIVIDEYGVVRGMITLKDIIENIIGDLPERGEKEDSLIIKRDDKSYLVDGETLLDDLHEIINFNISDHERGFVTIAGYFIHKIKKMPVTGDKIELRDFSMEIVDMDGNKIDKFLITKMHD